MTGDRPTIPSDALSRVLTRYPDLGSLVAVERDGLSVNTATCLFRTEAGRYFIKRYDPLARPSETIAAEHRLVERLLDAGYPTPALFRNREGSTVTWIDEAPYAIFEPARGEDCYGQAAVFEPYRSPFEARSAGRRLAEFHLALAGAPGFRPRPLVGLTARYDLLRAPDFEIGLRDLFAEAPLLEPLLAGRPDWPWVLEQLRGYHRAIAPESRDWPIGLIHGDFIKRNLFWEGDEVSAVIDFDLWNVAPWVYDLAIALLPVGFNWPELLDGVGEPRWMDMRAMLAGYQEGRPLRGSEIRLLKPLMASARAEFYLSAMACDVGRRELFWNLLVGSLRWFEAHPLPDL